MTVKINEINRKKIFFLHFVHFEDESLDENIIDFDARKAKARRAHEEVLSGKYRQPNFVGSKYSQFNLLIQITIKQTQFY